MQNMHAHLATGQLPGERARARCWLFPFVAAVRVETCLTGFEPEVSGALVPRPHLGSVEQSLAGGSAGQFGATVRSSTQAR